MAAPPSAEARQGVAPVNSLASRPVQPGMLRQDLRYAVRCLFKRPGFAAVAVVTLALGIGANTAMFTVVDAVLLRPLPYLDASRIVRVRGLALQTRQPGNLSPMDFLDLRQRATSFERLAAFNNYADATLTGGGEPERIVGTRVTADFLAALHTTPVVGRDFRGDDDVPGASPVAILSYGFWQRRFAGNPSIVPSTISLNGTPTTVIGVLPGWFRHPLPEDKPQPDVYVPFRLDPAENNRGGHYLQAIGLLRAGVAAVRGEAELASIAADLERAYPSTNAGRGVVVTPLLDAIVGQARSPLVLLLAMVGFVLLIACANMANLLLARSAARRKEIAVRQAIGASRVDLVRQLLTESVVLSLAGGGAGLIVAAWAIRVLKPLGADRIPRAADISIDLPVLLFTAVAAVATGVIFGIGPALLSTRSGTQGALREGGSAGEGRLHVRTQQGLIAAEIALALMLLVGAGLLVKSLWRLERVDPGFRTDQVLAFQMSLPLARYAEGDEIPFYQRLEDRLRTLPEIRRIGAINILPLSGNYSCDGFAIVGRSPAPPGQEPCAESRSITPGYFAAMGIPILRGRAFGLNDVENAPPVLIISREMADRFWPGQDPIGSRVIYQKTPHTVVGIVGGVRHFGLDRDAPFEMYTPHAQQPSYHAMTIVIGTSSDAASLMPMVRRELSALDRDVPISNVRALGDVVGASTTEPRLRALLLGAFAVLAVLLAAIGVAGVIAYAVGRRTQEIGVRVALGARGADVVFLMLRQGLAPAVVGIVLGLAGAIALTRVLSALLFDVAPLDASVFAAATALLTLVALVASYLPARRAAAVDPMIALRAE